jgi:hypothetical protein
VQGRILGDDRELTGNVHHDLTERKLSPPAVEQVPSDGFRGLRVRSVLADQQQIFDEACRMEVVTPHLLAPGIPRYGTVALLALNRWRR